MPTMFVAREWYRRFGFDPTVISPTGRVLFEFLLAEVDRLNAGVR